MSSLRDGAVTVVSPTQAMEVLSSLTAMKMTVQTDVHRRSHGAWCAFVRKMFERDGVSVGTTNAEIDESYATWFGALPTKHEI